MARSLPSSTLVCFSIRPFDANAECHVNCIGSGRYEAIRNWNSCLKSPDSEFWVQLAPGTAVVVDNYRVLHGRSAFTGKRRMCGAYIGRDDYRARLDGLGGRFAKEEDSRGVWDL
jgi:alpha-ketoglutarate-dependent taurine dioxygenase